MDKGIGQNDLDKVFAICQRAIVVSCVVALHVVACNAWLNLTPDTALPRRDMEVAMLAAPAVSHAQKPPLRMPTSTIRIPKPLADKVVPELPQPETEVIREREMPGAATATPTAAEVPIVQAVVQDAKPNFAASYSNNHLEYPLLARRLGIQGQVVLDVQVLADGQCGQAGVAQSSGHDMLDRAALESVKTWHFVPARYGSQAVTRWFRVPITFSLKDDQA